MAGINLGADARVIGFYVVDPADDNVVVTVSVPLATLPGTDPGRGKVSSFAEFPGKGRATGGVRAHAFLKGEGMLSLAWVGPDPARAVAADGTARPLPETLAKRDASGQPLDNVVATVGSAVGAQKLPLAAAPAEASASPEPADGEDTLF
jgi:DNA gyrase subunit A